MYIGNQFTTAKTDDEKVENAKTLHPFEPESVPAYAGSIYSAIWASRHCWKCGETDEHGNHLRKKKE